MPSKTPILVPLRDENMPSILRGKLCKGNGVEKIATAKNKNPTFDKNVFTTPIGPRNRAPLGMKTTNARINAFKTPTQSISLKESEINQVKLTSTRRPRRVVPADSIKLDVLSSDNPLEPDVEYCPPAPKDFPYQSDTFPDNCLDYSFIQPHNLLRDLCKKNTTIQKDGTNMSKLEREEKLAYQRDAKSLDDAVLKLMEEDWTVGDVPETLSYSQRKCTRAQPVKHEITEKKKSYAQYQKPSTLTSKRACRALSGTRETALSRPKASKSESKKPFLKLSSSKSSQKPFPSVETEINYSVTSNATSRSTIGYSKGRDVPKVLKEPVARERGNVNTVKGLSIDSGRNVKRENLASNHEQRRPGFLKIYEVEEDLEPALRGILPEYMKNEVEDEFLITLK